MPEAVHSKSSALVRPNGAGRVASKLSSRELGASTAASADGLARNGSSGAASRNGTVRRGRKIAVVALSLSLTAAFTFAEDVFSSTPASASSVLCSGYVGCNGAGYSDHGYGANSGASYWGQDSGHNCTNYVAYLEAQAGIAKPSFPLGDAWQWYSEASGKIAEGATPVVGSVAWYGQNQGGVGSDGHVAYVEAVSGTAGNYSIEISEDAFPSGPYDWRTIGEGDARWPGGFIYFNLSSGTPITEASSPHGYIDSTAAINAKTAPGADGWTQEVGPGNATRFAMSGTYQIFLRGDGTVFAKNTMGPGNWVQETSPHSATAVAISDTGLQLIIGPDGSIESKTTIGFGGWTQEVGPGNASKIAVGGNNMMFLRGDGTVFAKVGAGGPWTQETSANSALAIAVSNTGLQLMIVVNGEVDSRRGVGFGGWTQEVGPGNATAIALGGDNMMFLRGDGTVFSKVGQGGPWTQETSPNSATAIAVGENGLNMMLVVNGEVDTRQGPGVGGWTAETAPSSATAIAAG